MLRRRSEPLLTRQELFAIIEMVMRIDARTEEILRPLKDDDDDVEPED
jgi:hypothetical protein